MKASDIPVKFQIPFANAAGSGYTNPIPLTSQIGIKTGAASLPDGFPPAAFVQPSAGGAGPFGADFNGLLNQVTAWNRWQNSGGTVTYDATFAAAIGGYPLGATLASTTAGRLWISTVDDNTSNPDASGAGWMAIQPAGSDYSADTGTANAYSVTLSPAPTALLDGMKVRFKALNTNTAASTLTVNGLTAHAIVASGGTALAGGEILAAGEYEVTYNLASTRFEIVGQSAGQVIVPTATVSGAATNLAQVTTAITSYGYQTAPQVNAAIVASRPRFVSTNQTVTLSSKLTVAHGLGAVPVESEFYLICTTAQAPFAVGDLVRCPTNYNVGNIQLGTDASADPTNVYVRTGSGIRLSNDTGGYVTITISRWAYIAVAKL
jgi:hypothetical protein